MGRLPVGASFLLSDKELFMSTVALHPESLGVTVSGHTHEFHYLWLRHHCDSSRHPQTGERTLDPAEIDPEIRPASARAVARRRLVGDARSQLARRIGEPVRRVGSGAMVLRLGPRLGGHSQRRRGQADLVGALRRRRHLQEGSDRRRRRRPQLGHRHRSAHRLARGAEASRSARSHFGRIEDLRPDNTTNKNTDQLGYTNAGVDLHTDQTYLSNT